MARGAVTAACSSSKSGSTEFPLQKRRHTPMAASRAVTGNTAKFYIGDFASPPNYTAVLEVKSFKPNLLTVPEVPTTHLLSPNATEEFIPGLIKPGTAQLSGNLIGDATQLQFLALAQAQTVFPWKASGPIDKGSKTYTVSGTGYI